ncbi:hypothetical protein M0R36_04220 [bacterium]|jgi:hypothetical protein|nr:hypothetical protein [bacterium]
MRNNLFRTDVVRAGDMKIDRDNNIIYGFAVVSKGVTKDERGEFDDKALDDVVCFGNKSTVGVKSRFGHPNMSNTALGTFLGRVKSFRRDGEVVRADLYIDKTAFDAPDGDLGGYVLKLAESDPAMFGASMVIHWDAEKKEELDDKGNELPPIIRVTKLLSVDVVDDPAANNGLFGSAFFSDSVKPSAEMSGFLDKFLAEASAVDKMIGFLDRYRTNKELMQKEEKGMEAITIEQLKNEHKELFDTVFQQGVENGVKEERTRVVSIMKTAEEFTGMNQLALSAIEEGLSEDKSRINFQHKRLKDLELSSAPQVGPDDEEEPKKQMSHLEKAKQFQQEHGGTITDALKATAEKRT